MKVFKVHVEENEDGSLPPAKWVEVKEASPSDAIVAVLRKTPERRPARAFVGLGPVHDNGAPLVVRSYSLTWGDESCEVGS